MCHWPQKLDRKIKTAYTTDQNILVKQPALVQAWWSKSPDFRLIMYAGSTVKHQHYNLIALVKLKIHYKSANIQNINTMHVSICVLTVK